MSLHARCVTSAVAIALTTALFVVALVHDYSRLLPASLFLGGASGFYWLDYRNGVRAVRALREVGVTGDLRAIK